MPLSAWSGRGLVALATAVVCSSLAAPAPALGAAPAASCADTAATAERFVQLGPGGAYWLENLGFDGRGGMWVSELVLGQLVRLDATGRQTASFAISQPGASLLGPDGKMYALFGDG